MTLDAGLVGALILALAAQLLDASRLQTRPHPPMWRADFSAGRPTFYIVPDNSTRTILCAPPGWCRVVVLHRFDPDNSWCYTRGPTAELAGCFPN